MECGKKEVRSEELCSPLRYNQGIKKQTVKAQADKEKKDKKRQETEDLSKARMIEQYVFLFLLRDDGRWLRVGDIVTVEGMSFPFVICKLFMGVEGCAGARLVKVLNSGLEENFVITCSVRYIVSYCGGKVSLKGLVKEQM
jgi:hypothetical protein